MSQTDKVVVSTVVEVDPGTAFEIFTEDIDQWWRHGPRFRTGKDEGLCFEPGPDGRLVALSDEGTRRDLGRVLAWEPDNGRLVFEHRDLNFEQDETTEVEVRFEAVDGGTRVTLEHRGFDALREDHPVRHGLAGQAFVAMFGSWWGDLLVSLRQHAKDREIPR